MKCEKINLYYKQRRMSSTIKKNKIKALTFLRKCNELKEIGF